MKIKIKEKKSKQKEIDYTEGVFANGSVIVIACGDNPNSDDCFCGIRVTPSTGYDECNYSMNWDKSLFKPVKAKLTIKK